MTDPHPLTDEKCNKLSIFDLDECSAAYAYGIMADMRTAYDKGGEDMAIKVKGWLKDNVGMLLLSIETEMTTRYLESLEDEFIQDFIDEVCPPENK